MKNFALNSIVVTILNATVYLANFMVLVAIAALFGAGGPTDAFFLAFAIPSFFVGAVVNGVTSAFLPVIADYQVNHPSELGKLIGSSLFLVLLLAAGLAIVTGICAPTIIGITASHNEYAGFANLATQLTLILLPVIVVQITTGVLSAVFNSTGQFWVPPVTDAIGTIITLIIMVLFQPSLGVFSIALGFVGGAVAHLLMLIALWFRTGIQIVWTWRPNVALRRSFTLSLPLIMGTAVLQFGVVISRFLAAQLPEGSVTVLDYANRLSGGVMELLTSGVLLVTLVDWSKVVAQKDQAGLLLRLRQTILMMLFLVLPIVSILMALRLPVIAIAFQRGQFDSTLTIATGGVLLLFLLGIPVDTIGRIYVRLFLVWQDITTISRLAVLRLLFTVVCSVALIGVFGVRGLALADTLGVVFVTISFVVLAHRKLDSRKLNMNREITKIIVIALTGGVVAFGMGQLLANTPLIIVVILASGVGGLVSLGVAQILRLEQLETVIIMAQGILARESKV